MGITLAAYLQRALTNLTMKTFLCLAVLLAVAMEIRAQGNWNPCPSNAAADCAADPKMALAFCCAKHVGRLPWPVGAECVEGCVAEDICKEHRVHGMCELREGAAKDNPTARGNSKNLCMPTWWER